MHFYRVCQTVCIFYEIYRTTTHKSHVNCAYQGLLLADS